MKLSEKLSGRKVRVKDLSLSTTIRPKCPKTGKVVWESKALAKHQARLFKIKSGSKMGVYECSTCKGWHYGHKLYHRKFLKHGPHFKKGEGLEKKDSN